MTGTDEARDPAPDSSEAEVPPFHPDLLEVYLRRRIRGGGVYFGLILLLLATLVSLPLVEVPIAVRAEGYLRASAETQSLIAPSSGEVAWVRARDRRSVARGDTILLLNRPDLYVRLEAIRARRVSVEQECRDLERLIAALSNAASPQQV